MPDARFLPFPAVGSCFALPLLVRDQLKIQSVVSLSQLKICIKPKIMSKPIVVCQTAQDAVDVCLKLGAAATTDTGRDGNSKFKEKGNPLRKVHGNSRGEVFKPKLKKNTLKKGFERDSSSIDAPIVNDIAIIGDSIGMRLARQNKVYAPKYMKLCYGGATFQSMQESIKQVEKCNSVICIILGMNNVLKKKQISKENINALIEEMKKKGGQDIYILTVPPICKSMTHESNEQILLINNLIRDVNDSASNIQVVDIHTKFCKADGSVQEDLFTKFHYSGAPDFIHPNSTGLNEIQKMLLDAVKSQMH